MKQILYIKTILEQSSSAYHDILIMIHIGCFKIFNLFEDFIDSKNIKTSFEIVRSDNIFSELNSDFCFRIFYKIFRSVDF